MVSTAPGLLPAFLFLFTPPLSPTITFFSHPVVNGDCPWPSRPHVKRERQPLPPGPLRTHQSTAILFGSFSGVYDPSGCTRRPSTLASCPLSRRRDHQCNYHHHHQLPMGATTPICTQHIVCDLRCGGKNWIRYTQWRGVGLDHRRGVAPDRAQNKNNPGNSRQINCIKRSNWDCVCVSTTASQRWVVCSGGVQGEGGRACPCLSKTHTPPSTATHAHNTTERSNTHITFLQDRTAKSGRA